MAMRICFTPIKFSPRRCVIRGREEKLQSPWDWIGKPSPLFKELKDDEADAHRNKYAGSQTLRSSKLTVDVEANKVKGSKVSGGVPRKEQKKQASASKLKMPDAGVSIAKLDIRV